MSFLWAVTLDIPRTIPVLTASAFRFLLADKPIRPLLDPVAQNNWPQSKTILAISVQRHRPSGLTS